MSADQDREDQTIDLKITFGVWLALDAPDAISLYLDHWVGEHTLEFHCDGESSYYLRCRASIPQGTWKRKT